MGEANSNRTYDQGPAQRDANCCTKENYKVAKGTSIDSKQFLCILIVNECAYVSLSINMKFALFENYAARGRDISSQLSDLKLQISLFLPLSSSFGPFTMLQPKPNIFF